MCNGGGGQGWYRTAEQQPAMVFGEGYVVGQSVNSGSRYKALFRLGRNGLGFQTVGFAAMPSKEGGL